MRAVWLVLVAGFRRQWRSWVLLGLLIAVASGFVLASTAAGRRTDAAFPRYVVSHGYDAIVYTVQPLPKGLLMALTLTTSIDSVPSAPATWRS